MAEQENGRDSCCDSQGARRIGPALYLSLAITIVFVVAEVVAGHLAHSLALISDAGHNFTDALSLSLSAYAIWVARRPANERKTFGYHRVAILTALFNAATLMAIAVGILVEALHAFQSPHSIDSRLMLWTAGAALIINSAIVWALHGGAQNSLNIRATYVHMATDVIASILVLLTAFAIHATGNSIFDPVASVVIAVIILVSSLKIVREATNILLEAAPEDLQVNAMVDELNAIPRVQAVHDVHVWTVSDGMNYMSCHVEVAESETMAECGKIMREINQLLFTKFKIAHSTIQMEMNGLCTSDNAALDPLYCGGMVPLSKAELASSASSL